MRKLSDQLRNAIMASDQSRYAMCKQIDLDQSVLSRFVAGKGGLSIESLDKLAEVLGLVLVTKNKSKGR